MTSLRLAVITQNLATGDVVSERTIDHENREDRVWLGRHCYWAFRNGHAVITFNRDDEPEGGGYMLAQDTPA